MLEGPELSVSKHKGWVGDDFLSITPLSGYCVLGTVPELLQGTREERNVLPHVASFR